MVFSCRMHIDSAGLPQLFPSLSSGPFRNLTLICVKTARKRFSPARGVSVPSTFSRAVFRGGYPVLVAEHGSGGLLLNAAGLAVCEIGACHEFWDLRLCPLAVASGIHADLMLRRLSVTLRTPSRISTVETTPPGCGAVVMACHRHAPAPKLSKVTGFNVPITRGSAGRGVSTPVDSVAVRSRAEGCCPCRKPE